MQGRGMEVGEIIKHPSEHTHENTHTHTCNVSAWASITLYSEAIQEWKYLTVTGQLWHNTVQCFIFLSFLSLPPPFFFFLHVTFNTALALHMEASLKLVIAGYVEVRSLIRAMCSGHYVCIFHVSPRGNQSSRWPTRALWKKKKKEPGSIFMSLLCTCMAGKHEGQHLVMHRKYCSPILKCRGNSPEGAPLLNFVFDLLWRSFSAIYHISVPHEHSDLYCLILLVKTTFFLISSSGDLMTLLI